jgi:conjugative relaxase-like TrwC/TraI family protein
VLTVAKVNRSSAGGYADYLDAKAQPSQLGDYYLKDGERREAPGRWVTGADQFNLDPHAAVTGEQLRTLMDVRRPDSGEPLRRAGSTGEAVSALDATFSAPKSVSAVWAIAGPELRARVEAAHEAAVDRALAYAVRQVPMLRRRVSQDTAVHEKATGVIATSWRHSTARAVEQQVPDPQLHSHVLLHGAVREDGEIVAIDSRSWLVHQREVGAAYRTELGREMARLGFQVRRGTGRGGRYFELEAIPQPLLDRWSSRHHQVQAAIQGRLDQQRRELQATIDHGGLAAIDAARQLEALEESGQLSPKQERMMATSTRSPKQPTTNDDLDAAWRRTALDHGVSRERIEVLRRQRPSPTPVVDDRQQVLRALTEFDATFAARDARAIALERSAGAPIDHALEQLRALREADDILVLDNGTGTTHQHRGKERTVVAITQRLTENRVTPLPARAHAREAERLDQLLAQQGGKLSDEQRNAIALACGDRPLVVIEGQAGTGKSTALIGIARAHQATGREIIITSTAGLAAERLAQELSDNDVRCEAYSTVALHSAISRGNVTLGPQTTIIHDEAALASTQEQLNLLHDVERTGARLIAVGDPRQSQPVGAGGLWGDIEDAATRNGSRVQLTRNQRAQDEHDRRDQALFRDGHAERALRGYAARERVHLTATAEHAEDQALEAAQRDHEQGAVTIVIAQTSNDHLDELNARAQAIRHQNGELGNESIEISGRPYALHPGDDVQIRRTLHRADGNTIRNGAAGHVTRVGPDTGIELELADGSTVALSTDEIEQSDLRLAYVQHPFPAQGRTTDTAHLIAGDRPTREGTYVAITRPRHAAHIYAAEPQPADDELDRLTPLADRLNRTEPDLPSIRSPLASRPTSDRNQRRDTPTQDRPARTWPARETAGDGREADSRSREQASQETEPPGGGVWDPSQREPERVANESGRWPAASQESEQQRPRTTSIER